MSINGIHGTTTPLAPASTAADGGLAGAAASRSRTAEAKTPEPTDAAENKPAPLRFPWLSRLSTQLAAASKTPTTFAAPILGDNLDKQA